MVVLTTKNEENKVHSSNFMEEEVHIYVSSCTIRRPRYFNMYEFKVL